MKLRIGFIVVALAGLVAHPVGSSQVLAPPPGQQQTAVRGAPDCNDGVVLDDGTLETAYGWVPTAVDGRYVQEFTSWDFPTRKIDEVCICWTRTRPDDELTFTVELYRPAHGAPSFGPVAAVEATATMVPAFPDGGFVSVDVSEADMIAPHGTFFIGVSWNPSVDQYFFVCADQGPLTEVVDGWLIDDRADEWTSFLETSDPIFAEHRALMVRARAAVVFEEPVPTLGTWGLAILIAGLAVFGWLVIRRGVDS